jgi:hypothetical protein
MLRNILKYKNIYSKVGAYSFNAGQISFIGTHLLSNGQAYFFLSGLTLYSSGMQTFYVSNDFFSNQLWVVLDQPKIFHNLIRFFRRYTGGTESEVNALVAQVLKTPKILPFTSIIGCFYNSN